jgi:prolipoprotein diacylglyceryltransferase
MATNFRLITYLFCYGISRFVMEFFRYDHERGISATSFLTPSQLWATVSILLAITGYCIQHKQTLS